MTIALRVKTFILDADLEETLTVLPGIWIVASATVNSNNRIMQRISKAVAASEDTREPLRSNRPVTDDDRS